ncbi:hypothetical protein BHE74_00042742 [Ensete ventricosum]|nr:hypothetical protein BHE74_00042742 [Ensete ventricosum]
MPGDRCRSRWFHRQRTGVVGSGCRHHMAVGGSGEEEEHSLGCWHRSKIARGAVAGEEEGTAVRQSARRGYDSKGRALLGREGIVGRTSYPVTIKQRGGARRWPQEKRGQAVKEGMRDLHKKEINKEKGQ